MPSKGKFHVEVKMVSTDGDTFTLTFDSVGGGAQTDIRCSDGDLLTDSNADQLCELAIDFLNDIGALIYKDWDSSKARH